MSLDSDLKKVIPDETLRAQVREVITTRMTALMTKADRSDIHEALAREVASKVTRLRISFEAELDEMLLAVMNARYSTTAAGKPLSSWGPRELGNVLYMDGEPSIEYPLANVSHLKIEVIG